MFFFFSHLNIITQSYSERQMFIKNKAKIKTHNLIHLNLSFKGLKDVEGLSYKLFHKCHIFSLKGKDFKTKVK